MARFGCDSGLRKLFRTFYDQDYYFARVFCVGLNVSYYSCKKFTFVRFG